jgi:hypothetical protein
MIPQYIPAFAIVRIQIRVAPAEGPTQGMDVCMPLFCLCCPV